MALSSVSSPRPVLELDGSVAQLVDFAGLGFAADIAVTSLATQVQRKKSVANFRFTPGQARVGLGMGRGLYNWIKASMDRSGIARIGAVKMLDMNYRVLSALNFTDALLTSFTVPRLDGSSRELGVFDIGFDVGRVTSSKGDNSDIRSRLEPANKSWLVSNFKVSIGNLPCARVAAVEAFTWRCVYPSLSGAQTPREPTGNGVQAAVPDLKLSISAADYPAWLDAATKWFIGGQHLEADEMRGRITLLGPNMVDELAAIELYNVGFKSFAHEDGLSSQADAVRRFTVELYVERMALSITAYGP
jgi:hypothetical protein